VVSAPKDDANGTRIARGQHRVDDREVALLPAVAAAAVAARVITRQPAKQPFDEPSVAQA
jgi:hypothetical protein